MWARFRPTIFSWARASATARIALRFKTALFRRGSGRVIVGGGAAILADRAGLAAIADLVRTLGLEEVHHADEHLAELCGKTVRILDWDRLAAAAEIEPGYLQLSVEQGERIRTFHDA